MRSSFVPLALGAMAMIGLPQLAAATTISGSYFEDTAPYSCVNTLVCGASFPTMPSALTGKFVEIESMNCRVSGQVAVAGIDFFITDEGSADFRRSQYLDPPVGAGYRTFNRPIRLKVAGGPPRQLRLALTLAATSNVATFGECNIVGTITTQ